MWLVVLLVGLCSLVYLWSRKTFSYFSRRGFPQDPGYFPFGSLVSWQVMVGKKALRDVCTPSYENFPGAKVVGYYGVLGQKVMVIKDLDLCKRILIKDFNYFTDRRDIVMDEEANKYFINMLSLLKGEKWKLMRGLISPIFTSGKLKAMVPLVHQVGNDLDEHLDKLSKEGGVFEAKELMTFFGLDTICTTGFGVQPNSFKNPDNPLTDATMKLAGLGKHKMPILGFFRLIIVFFLPKVGKFFKVPFLDPEATGFIVDLIKKTVQERQTSGKLRNDFIDNMVSALKNRDKADEPKTSDEDQFERDARILDADNSQAAVFTKEEFETVLISNLCMLLFAGFDTTSSTLSMILYYLAANPDVQEKLYQEIQAAFEANNGSPLLSYDSIQSLEYMEMCILESMRAWPIGAVERLCVKDYKIPDTDLIIEKGMLVQIPGPEIMKDPEYFPNPEKFQPENFSKEARNKRGPYHFMSFGHGPRNCVGMRFALLAMKIALLRLVGHYKLRLSEKTKEPLVCITVGLSQLPKGGVWLTLEKRT